MYDLTFAVVSVISVFSYYFLGNKEKWIERGVNDIQTAYWNAFQTLIWSIGVLFLRGGNVTIWTILPILPTTFIYGEISELPGFAFDLTSKIPPVALTILILIALVFVTYVVYLTYTRSQCCSLYMNVQFFAPFILFLAWMLSWLFMLNPSQSVVDGVTVTTTRSMHVHHWMIGVIGFLLAKDGTIVSDIISGIFWGVFCQAMASYGLGLPIDTKITIPAQPPSAYHVYSAHAKT